jgi:hypothetical protein
LVPTAAAVAGIDAGGGRVRRFGRRQHRCRHEP